MADNAGRASPHVVTRQRPVDGPAHDRVSVSRNSGCASRSVEIRSSARPISWLGYPTSKKLRWEARCARIHGRFPAAIHVLRTPLIQRNVGRDSLPIPLPHSSGYAVL